MIEGYSRVDVGAHREAEFLAVAGWAFIFTSKDEDLHALARAVPWERTRGMEIASAEAGATRQLVAVHASARYDMWVPGGKSVPVAGLMWVGVHQGHRRRGLLTQMMNDHFDRSLARGEVISTLFAAEPGIYQRFGYGLACPALALTLGRSPGLRDVEGADRLRVDLEDADRERHQATVVAVLAREGRPGTPRSLTEEMLADVFMDVPAFRDGRERKRIAIVTDDEGPAAFATFARKSKWNDGGPAGTTAVQQWAAATAPATGTLFAAITDLDLTAETTVPNVAMDHPLIHLLTDPRSPQPRRNDNLWVRILDVPRALEARGYLADADFTMRVLDSRLPANDAAWRVSITGGTATVTRANSEADFELSIQELSAAYLGGVTLAELAVAGLVTGDRAAIAAASAAVRGVVAPVSSINF